MRYDCTNITILILIVLKRSVETYELLVKTMPMQKPVPVISSWRLNERHYGSLVGLSKEDAELEMGMLFLLFFFCRHKPLTIVVVWRN
jgi:bisphosphoglycerate-dependent phosphoglycerate mutase